MHNKDYLISLFFLLFSYYKLHQNKLNLIHSKEISKIILQTYKKAEGIYNLTRKKMTPLSLFIDYLEKKKKKRLK